MTKTIAYDIQYEDKSALYDGSTQSVTTDLRGKFQTVFSVGTKGIPISEVVLTLELPERLPCKNMVRGQIDESHSTSPMTLYMTHQGTATVHFVIPAIDCNTDGMSGGYYSSLIKILKPSRKAGTRYEPSAESVAIKINKPGRSEGTLDRLLGVLTRVAL
ncbi:MAG: hypothetical protein ACXWPM_02270 [Bdellovibrionota bacterium]